MFQTYLLFYFHWFCKNKVLFINIIHNVERVRRMVHDAFKMTLQHQNNVTITVPEAKTDRKK